MRHVLGPTSASVRYAHRLLAIVHSLDGVAQALQ